MKKEVWSYWCRFLAAGVELDRKIGFAFGILFLFIAGSPFLLYGSFQLILGDILALIGFSVVGVALIHWSDWPVVKAIQFKRRFGFYLPVTAEGRRAVRLKVDQKLKELALALSEVYKEDDKIKVALTQAEGAAQILLAEKIFHSHKRVVARRKKNFYSARKLAEKVGFGTFGDFNDYLAK